MKPVVWEEAVMPKIVPKILNQELGLEDLPYLWDMYAEDDFRKIHKLPCYKKMDKILESFFVQKLGSRVLDAGCGDGVLFKSILRGIHPSLIIGADLSKKMLVGAKRQTHKLQKYNFGYFDIELEMRDLSGNFPWIDDYFDATVSNMFSCFVPKPWEFVMHEMYRVTKNEGYIYLTTFLAGWDFSEIVKKHTLGEVMRSPIGLYHGLRLKKHPARITEIVKKAGLTYPYKDEIIAFFKNLGVKEILAEEIFWGAGVALRVQVRKQFGPG